VLFLFLVCRGERLERQSTRSVAKSKFSRILVRVGMVSFGERCVEFSKIRRATIHERRRTENW
jgi:hypothetical protein